MVAGMAYCWEFPTVEPMASLSECYLVQDLTMVSELVLCLEFWMEGTKVPTSEHHLVSC